MTVSGRPLWERNSRTAPTAMAAARSSGKRYTPVEMAEKATVLQPCSAASSRLLR